MNRAGKRLIPLFWLLAMAGLVAFLAGNAWAQQKTVEHQQTGPEEIEVQLTHSTVVFVDGNHLVTRQMDGSLEAFFIPESFRFHIEGRQISVHELAPGMVITEEVVTRTKPMMVKTVEIHEGTVWHRTGNRVLIRGKNGGSTSYTIPEWATITVEGKPETVDQLRPGMKINATIVTEEPFTRVEEESRTHAMHPARTPAAVVRGEHRSALSHNAENGEMAEAKPAPEEPATQPAAPEELPKTASPLPLIGVLGLLSLAASLGFGALRRMN
ncbi:MAG TPA: hypothetical protein VNJ12_07315 [Candidatus Dormibacteraeota bacterium]|nr:hypothetical protein [Candidatus Dormibacteraeota bacterium]